MSGAYWVSAVNLAAAVHGSLERTASQRQARGVGQLPLSRNWRAWCAEGSRRRHCHQRARSQQQLLCGARGRPAVLRVPHLCTVVHAPGPYSLS